MVPMWCRCRQLYWRGLARASDFGADLIVMGAYGHGRLRELVLGGVTRVVLESMTVPALFSH
ncbi:hypothetical protein AU476_33350 [Cupriavidus sp. UYMSc13B]|nr:hypothetical protein AU476_33350 [Cupriavidus sp. UYMSc13B]